MFAFLKHPQIRLAIVLSVPVVSLVFYLSLRNSYSSNKTSIKETTRENTTTSANPTISLDFDNDGIPDTAELQSYSDRENFRRWFTSIAEIQYQHLSKQWNKEQQDCAGLVRFAWREALRRHDRLWFQKMGPGYTPVAPDVRRYHLEQGPLGEKLFRSNFGSYKDGDLANGTFSEFADARTLKSFNSKFVSRDRRQAQPGDLLFFYQPWVQKFPYHVMIFLGRPGPGAGADGEVVYHTGASPTDDGTVKKVALSVLDHHPNKRWRPVESNSNFLGFYRLKILD